MKLLVKLLGDLLALQKEDDIAEERLMKYALKPEKTL
jgi:hypothetical protein